MLKLWILTGFLILAVLLACSGPSPTATPASAPAAAAPDGTAIPVSTPAATAPDGTAIPVSTPAAAAPDGTATPASAPAATVPDLTAIPVSTPADTVPDGSVTPASTPVTTSPSAGGAPPSGATSEDLQIQELLQASNAAMQAVESAHLVYEATTDVGNQLSLFVGIEGDYQAPDRFHYSMETGFGPGSGAFRLEYTLIGSRAFLKDPESGVWIPDPASQNPFAFLSPDGEPAEGLAINFDPQASEGFSITRQDLDGETVYYLRGNPSGEGFSDTLEALKSVVLGPEPGGGTEGESPRGKIEIEHWIGVEDLLARKFRGLFEVSGQDHTGELNTVRSEVSLVFSDYGKPVNIQEP